MSASLQDRDLSQEVAALEQLHAQLSACRHVDDRLSLLDALPQVQRELDRPGMLRTFMAGLSPDCAYALKAILALGQGGNVFYTEGEDAEQFERLRQLLQHLIELEQHYAVIGGIVGYHLTVLKLLLMQEEATEDRAAPSRFIRPYGLDLTEDSIDVREAILAGIDGMDEVGELYPVGGAGDRLNLMDPQSGEGLPAACLPFEGRTLLDGLFEDLAGREFLHFKLTGRAFQAPVALMTSDEKGNRRRIQKMCEDAHWFGRGKEGIRLFQQPLVPVISEDGNWCMKAPLSLHLKPGGHGVMWMLAKEQGVFDWFRDHGTPRVLVRQINNPVADTDGGLLGFLGEGLRKRKAFGFASCRRLLHTAEGVNVLREQAVDQRFSCGISNIEYTEFTKHGITETPVEAGSPFSEFPANTNILFADLAAVEEALTRLPIPGQLINMKGKVRCLRSDGTVSECRAGRLESTMQNIADALGDMRDTSVGDGQNLSLQTYLTSNYRHKTISVTKKAYVPGQSIEETPDGCFATMQRNYHELLQSACGMTVPVVGDRESYLRGEVPFIVFMHPGLGPLYSIIAQKIQGGSMARGSELHLDIAELELRDVHVRGSLFIRATSPLGHHDSEQRLHYSDRGGRCRLRQVRVENQGVDYGHLHSVWRDEIGRKESLSIILHGNAEFEASNVTIRGNHHFEVPHGYRLILLPNANRFDTVLERIDSPTWTWNYSVDSQKNIVLKQSGEGMRQA